MKMTDSFDPRTLRPKQPGRWRWRLLGAVMLLIAAFGLLSIFSGATALLRRQMAIEVLHIEPAGGVVLLVTGLLALWLGVKGWRLSRRRSRGGDGLSLSPRLMNKRN